MRRHRRGRPPLKRLADEVLGRPDPANARFLYLSTIQREYPRFFVELQDAMLSAVPIFLSELIQHQGTGQLPTVAGNAIASWAKRYGAKENRWLLDAAILTCDYWIRNPRSPAAQLQPDCSWFRLEPARPSKVARIPYVILLPPEAEAIEYARQNGTAADALAEWKRQALASVEDFCSIYTSRFAHEELPLTDKDVQRHCNWLVWWQMGMTYEQVVERDGEFSHEGDPVQYAQKGARSFANEIGLANARRWRPENGDFFRTRNRRNHRAKNRSGQSG